MPRDDRKPEKPKTADDGWFIDFGDDGEALDLASLGVAGRRKPGEQDRSRQGSQASPGPAGKPGPWIGDLLDPGSGDPMLPEAPESAPGAGPASAAKRDGPKRAPAGGVGEAPTEAASESADPGFDRRAREDDRSRSAPPDAAGAIPGREPVSTIIQGVTKHRGARTAPRRVRRRIVGASLLAACLAGGVLLPIGVRLTQLSDDGEAGKAPALDTIAETAMRRPSTQTSWQDPPAAAAPTERPIEVIALGSEETIATLGLIQTSVVLAPPDAIEGRPATDTSTALQPRGVTRSLSPTEVDTVEPSVTVLARMGPAVQDRSPIVVASANSSHALERHRRTPERVARVVSDGTGRPLRVARAPQRAMPIPRRIVGKAEPAATPLRETAPQATPKLQRSSRLAQRVSPVIPGQGASRQATSSDLAQRAQIRLPSTRGLQITRAEPPRALVLPASLQPTPF